VFATQVADITPLMDSMNLQVLIIDPTKLSAREQLASLRAKRKGLRIYTYNAQLEPF